MKRSMKNYTKCSANFYVLFYPNQSTCLFSFKKSETECPFLCEKKISPSFFNNLAFKLGCKRIWLFQHQFRSCISEKRVQAKKEWIP